MWVDSKQVTPCLAFMASEHQHALLRFHAKGMFRVMLSDEARGIPYMFNILSFIKKAMMRRC